MFTFTAVVDHVSDLAQHVITETSSGQVQEYIIGKRIGKWSPFHRSTADSALSYEKWYPVRKDWLK